MNEPTGFVLRSRLRFHRHSSADDSRTKCSRIYAAVKRRQYLAQPGFRRISSPTSPSRNSGSGNDDVQAQVGREFNSETGQKSLQLTLIAATRHCNFKIHTLRAREPMRLLIQVRRCGIAARGKVVLLQGAIVTVAPPANQL